MGTAPEGDQPTTDAAEQRAGRKRDPQRDLDLIRAAQELLAEVGYDKVTIEAVAARIGAGKATVYRRWKTKSDLVIDAIRAFEWDVAAPDTGALRNDLFALAEIFMARNPLRDGVMAGMATAMARDATIRHAVDEAVDRPRHDAFATILANAHARGEISRTQGWENVRDIFPAMMFYRVAMRNGTVDKGFVRDIIDDLTIPLLTRMQN
ncbi:MAG: TetR family transcriptional regulator [Nocardia sp.]|uniref:TetR/AcrR family transcriptional regulator n=1 Tax=Nocardia sp. TaxID=1821 RepID=UPI00260EB846|nr:TetR/AcrR family transcriptional regulator [Nocardia sp.]MCU1642781.1 TetR family transcriptional regulator [Nocardia sp.]